MKYLTLAIVAIFLVMPMMMTSQAKADDNSEGHYWYRSDNAPDISIWTNKGYGTTYYFGEDVAIIVADISHKIRRIDIIVAGYHINSILA